MMDAETFLTPEECLEYGFIDEISSKVTVSSNQNIIENNMQNMQEYVAQREQFVQQLKELQELNPKKPVAKSTQLKAGVDSLNKFINEN